MPRYPKKATFVYMVQDSRTGGYVNLKDLPEEKQHEIRVKAYQRFVRALGYEPVEK